MKKIILTICLIVGCYIYWVNSMTMDEKRVDESMPTLTRMDKVNEKSNYIISDTLVNEVFNLTSVVQNEKYILYKTSPNKLVYIYIISNDKYRRYIVDCNIENPDEVVIKTDLNSSIVVYLFPEYETVRAITISETDSIKDSRVYQILTSKESEAGGNFNMRKYEQDVEDALDEGAVFSIYNEFTKDEIKQETLEFGQYHFRFEK